MIIGISGPSGSGKTTIARALRQLYAGLPSTSSVRILHQDDFYKAEKDIPLIMTRAGKVVNWDCPQAVDMDGLRHTLQAYRENGKFPDEVEKDLQKRAKEDQNDVGETGVSAALLDRLKREGRVPLIANLLIVEGFMLFHAKELANLFDMAVLLRGSFSVLRDRREARSGYVTQEGFWKDPEGYFADCVWPEYVSNHQQFFQNGDVEGNLRGMDKVLVSKSLDSDLDESFSFVIQAIHNHVQ